MLKSISPFDEIFGMAGPELPEYLKGKKEDFRFEDVTDKENEKEKTGRQITND